MVNHISNVKEHPLVGQIHQILDTLRPTDLYKTWISRDCDSLKIGQREYQLSAFQNIHVIGIGKPAYDQVFSLKERLTALGISTTQPLSFTKSNHCPEHPAFHCFESSHPCCDQRSLHSGMLLLNAVKQMGPEDLFLFSISGGASSLTVLPRPPFTLDDKILLFQELLSSEANIEEMNLLRKEISLLKNGGLLAQCQAKTVVNLAISDIPSNQFDLISSGPTLFKETSADQLMKLVDTYVKNKELNSKLAKYIKSNQRLNDYQQVKKACENHDSYNQIICSDLLARTNAATKLSGQFQEIFVWPYAHNIHFKQGIEEHLFKMQELLNASSFALISGGELTYSTAHSLGMGGRNTHFVVAMAKKIFEDNIFSLLPRDLERLFIASVGTDGSDGPTDAAGGYMTYDLYVKGLQMGLRLDQSLIHFDSYNYLKKLNALIMTGPTGNNIMDLRFIFFNHC